MKLSVTGNLMDSSIDELSKWVIKTAMIEIAGDDMDPHPTSQGKTN